MGIMAAKGRKLLSLAAVLLLLGVTSAEASRYLPHPAVAALDRPPVTVGDIAWSTHAEPEPTASLELLTEQELPLFAALSSLDLQDAERVLASRRHRLLGSPLEPALERVWGLKTASGGFQQADGRIYLETGELGWESHRGVYLLQIDPLGPVDSPNLYQAFGFDAFNVTDPFGEGWLRDWETAPGGPKSPAARAKAEQEARFRQYVKWESQNNEAFAYAMSRGASSYEELRGLAVEYFHGKLKNQTAAIERVAQAFPASEELRERWADDPHVKMLAEAGKFGDALQTVALIEANLALVITPMVEGSLASGSAQYAFRRQFARSLRSGDEVFTPKGAPVLERFPEWRVGDPITKLTETGEYPIWTTHGTSPSVPRVQTIQGRYWMDRAASARPGEFTARQLRSMREGFAPQVRVRRWSRTKGIFENKWVSKELHHARGNRGVPSFDTPVDLYEVWPWEHAAIDSSRNLGYDVLEILAGNL